MAVPIFSATGDVGKLWVGYRLAAEIRNWSLTYSQDTLGLPDIVLVGRTSKVDDFWSTQPIDRVDILMGKAWWSWQAFECSPLILGKAVELTLKGTPVAKEA